jgi:trans-aconitate 2-methyltransferase
MADRTAPKGTAPKAWDPGQYLKFADHRLRPAIDLLNRIDLDAPARVFDLGCGAGNVTRLIAGRWPGAAVTGIDGSADMLAKARAGEGGAAIQWVQGDLGRWLPDAPAALLYSNAALHWLDNHAALFPRLFGLVAPDGVLAVQMPRNHGAPSHTCMTEAAAAGPWAERLRPHLRPAPTAEPAVYYDLLGPLAAQLDIWETEYLQVLDGDNPVVEWTKGTALKPLLDALDGAQRAGFLAEYGRRIAAAYPKRADGRTLFPFRRLFIVARR